MSVRKITVNIFYYFLLAINRIHPIVIVLLPDPRIGAFIGKTEVFLRGFRRQEEKKFVVFIYRESCNAFFIKMLRRKHLVLHSPLLAKICNKDPVKSRFVAGLKSAFQTNKNKYRDDEPYFSFTEEDVKEGRKLLREMDISGNDWFVCMHSRGNKYLKERSPDNKNFFDYHSFRNCSIDNYVEAAKYIVSKGGKVLRMGSVVEEEREFPQGIIDYSKYFRSSFADIFLCKEAKFFLGNTSGIYNAAAMFNNPVAGANIVPLDSLLMGKNDINIPKKIWSVEKKRFLTFKEMLALDLKRLRMDVNQEYTKKVAKIEILENTPGEIKSLAAEMNARIDGLWEETDEDKEMQKRFRSLFNQGHRCYGTESRIGAEFIKENAYLLD